MILHGYCSYCKEQITPKNVVVTYTLDEHNNKIFYRIDRCKRCMISLNGIADQYFKIEDPMCWCTKCETETPASEMHYTYSKGNRRVSAQCKKCWNKLVAAKYRESAEIRAKRKEMNKAKKQNISYRYTTFNAEYTDDQGNTVAYKHMMIPVQTLINEYILKKQRGNLTAD